MFVPCVGPGAPAPDFTGLTLLLPAVSVGNVGQLATDLIISTLNMPKVGYFYTDCLVPMVGNNPYATTENNSAELSINAEVYSLPSKNLIVLQIRSPFIKYKSRSFCEALLSWVKSSKCTRVLVLSSSHAYRRDDQQLQGTPFRYLFTPELQKNIGNQIQYLNWKEMEETLSFPEMQDSDMCIQIPGGGITKLLYKLSCSEGIQMAILLKFCSEGDNIPDAIDLANYLNEWLQVLKTPQSNDPKAAPPKWKIPSSWRLLFGSGLPPALF
ncbi:proteasome assembly chaperone 2 isoform X2 [Ornithorhynchus anatinus]|uniref:Proteasome assembly chaperone 2 n=1 Tax=Ornithorhynchus anatinus TaxID=9258 RepID=F6R4S0_ORNAN|nr:proteasome assembly chaperone 2 isoform X2 [Ornithorhynchus anatinus]